MADDVEIKLQRKKRDFFWEFVHVLFVASVFRRDCDDDDDDT